VNFERISYWWNGEMAHSIIADPREVSIFGRQFLTGKEVNKYGFKIRPHSYSARHPEGDGMVWAMICVDDVVKRSEMVFTGRRLKKAEENNGTSDL
jgi:hypothetical protein